MKAQIHRGMSSDEYHAEKEHLSASRMKQAFKSMRHFEVPEPAKTKKAFDLGNAFEYWLTDRAKFFSKVFVFSVDQRPDKTKTMAAGENEKWKAKIEKENEGKIIIMQKDYEMVKKMVEECERNKPIMAMIKNAEFQISIFWEDEFGLKVKCMPDLVIWLNEEEVMVIDIKSTQDASPRVFASQAMELHYPFQAIMQIKGLEALGLIVKNYYWLVCEKSEHLPIAQIYEFKPDDQDHLRVTYEDISKKILRSRQSGIYPGFQEATENNPFSVMGLEIPDWYIAKVRNL